MSFGVSSWNCHISDHVTLILLPLPPHPKPSLIPSFGGEGKAYANRNCDPNRHRKHQPLEFHFPKLENGLEEVEETFLAKRGLILQEVGPH